MHKNGGRHINSTGCTTKVTASSSDQDRSAGGSGQKKSCGASHSAVISCECVSITVYFIDFSAVGQTEGRSTTPPVRQRWLFPQRNEVSDEEAEAILGPHYPLLWRVVLDPFDDLARRRAEDRDFIGRETTDIAWWLHTPTRLQACRLFAGNPEICPRRLETGRHLLVCNDRCALTINKLKRGRRGRSSGDLWRSNYLTTANKDYWDQRRCGGGPD